MAGREREKTCHAILSNLKTQPIQNKTTSKRIGSILNHLSFISLRDSKIFPTHSRDCSHLTNIILDRHFLNVAIVPGPFAYATQG